MKIDSLLLRGELHEVYGEDAQYYSDLGDDWFVAAVMDGCSSGTESYFASALLAKLLRKNCKTLPLLAEINPDLDLDSYTPQGLGEFLLSQIFDDLKRTRKLLLSDKLELLSTLVLLVYHKPSKKAYICASGDGFLKINDEFIDLDQNNMPDYMAYSLNLHFEQWMENHTRTFIRENITSIFVSTDGIQKYFNSKNKPSSTINSVSYFLEDGKLSLEKKDEELRSKHKLFPFDDVSIISIKS